MTYDKNLPGKIVSHRGFLQQILTNLIKNAAQALKEDHTPDCQINIAITSKPGQCIIKVSDNGPGIPADIQAKIFDPFFTTKEVGKGTGLGLSVTYNLAQKMGGKLSLVSCKGHTCFTLSLPNKIAL